MKRFFADIFRSCRKHDILNLSANISFFAIIALLPLVMIFVAVLGLVMGSDAVITDIANKFTEVVPGADKILLSNIHNLVESRGSLGLWGIGFLFLVSTVLFGSIERAFDEIFGSMKKRHFLYSRLLSILVIFIILIFLSLPSAVRLLNAFLATYGLAIPFADYLSGKAFFVAFAVAAYIATVTIVTNHKIFIKYAFVGGVIFAAGVAVAKYIFQWYLFMTFDKYNVIYGSLTAMILTIIWIYYLSIILLVASEAVAFLQRKRVGQ